MSLSQCLALAGPTGSFIQPMKRDRLPLLVLDYSLNISCGLKDTDFLEGISLRK